MNTAILGFDPNPFPSDMEMAAELLENGWYPVANGDTCGMYYDPQNPHKALDLRSAYRLLRARLETSTPVSRDSGIQALFGPCVVVI